MQTLNEKVCLCGTPHHTRGFELFVTLMLYCLEREMCIVETGMDMKTAFDGGGVGKGLSVTSH